VIDAVDAPHVRRGHTLREAKALCPQAAFIEANFALYQDVTAEMLDALELIAPVVEEAGIGTAYADVAGLRDHYADAFDLAGALVAAVRDATALLPAAGLASNKFVAWVAASRTLPGDAGLVPEGREREFLRDKSVALLPIDGKRLHQLELLALRTLGDIASLPRPAFVAQFRPDGGRIWDLVNGIDGQPLRARTRQETLNERLAFDAAVVSTEALVLAARQLAVRLVRRLRGRTARRMHVQLLADGRTVWERLETFREPTGDEARMALVLKTRLSLLELPQGIDTVSITLSGIGREIAKQAKLFSDAQQNLNQIAEAIRQLRARYGRPVVWRIAEVDPCSRHPEERAALIPYDA
jgi:nucleotidyltransferase/DNA polymerase involved in DNA repair